MTRFALAAVLVAALGGAAGAQPTPPPNQNPDPIPNPNPVPPLPTYVGPPGPGVPIFKSGGTVVGTEGYFPYDTGNWLLGGVQPATRQSGWYTMVYPGGGAVPAYGPAVAPARGHFGKHGLFRR
jgi:hypothetical protein